ncbi:hypothetical protein MtrunA17_Chr8g0375721 [Medicago truncatula]|uniref:Uncharacterized protein n=1 Tax=Medicago truncatula TaxID=3880 RepID=A0A396GMR9_MEDTR|nr:hypothetical protein MtrunA17_Chr8g0375721 [Medicago truncatula]
MPILSATLAFSCCSGYDRFFIISYNETKILWKHSFEIAAPVLCFEIDRGRSF